MEVLEDTMVVQEIEQVEMEVLVVVQVVEELVCQVEQEILLLHLPHKVFQVQVTAVVQIVLVGQAAVLHKQVSIELVL